MSGRLQLYWDTLRGLHPEQIRHQALRRLPALYRHEPRPLPAGPIPERTGWGTGAPRCPGRLEPQVLDGRFEFWGLGRVLDLRRRWEAPDLGASWNYPVHYFDAAPPLARHAVASGDAGLREALCRSIDRWIVAHPMATSLGWDAYPTALRIVNWLDVVHVLGAACDRDWRDRVLRHVYLQAGWLEPRLERHLLGTHLLKDAKALVFAGNVFADAAGERWRRSGEALVGREILRQVQADGGHIEPSVYYNGVALEDVLDLVNLGVAEPSVREALSDAARRMASFLTGVMGPDGGYPLLGDAERDGLPRLSELLEYARRLGFDVASPPDGLRLFPDSGFAVYRDARHVLVADVGPIAASYMPGHGHCDSLSFEWWVEGLPLIVDSGTRSYEVGPERSASRATRAHNTVEVDGKEQHEIWAAFRVARRSEVRAAFDHAALGTAGGRDAITATLVPWHDPSLRLTRRFEPHADGLRIVDRLEGAGEHRVESWLHLHPDCQARRDGRDLVLRRGAARARITILGPEFELQSAEASGSVCCESFGVARPNAAVRMVHAGPLPWDCEIRLTPD